MSRYSMLAVVLAAIAAPANAQAQTVDYAQMQATMDASQAAANRPGDEALGCEALEAELVSTAQTPEFQAYVAKAGAQAQQEIAASRPGSAQMASQAAMTLFSSVVPGGAWAGHSAAVGQAESQRAQAQDNIQQRMVQAQEFMAIAPVIMRGQRVLELAQARDCAWFKAGAGP